MKELSIDESSINYKIREKIRLRDFVIDVPSEYRGKGITMLFSVSTKKLLRLINCPGVKPAEIFNFKAPFWIKKYDRDTVAFYQKPDPLDFNKTINADLIFPPIIKNSFGGEVVGSGQRQDNAKEMIDSLSRQKIDRKPYEWYINLRKIPNYQTTSGFGLGIERFITWSLCRDNIRDVILYPRLKDVDTCP
ncbi:MAG: hypothetical protein NTY81_02485 [Candidatus Staskawiczbacteria bacterium]|nr:hypothetical protein [Candidatus Staskawiczbacteria bacterium]